MGGMDWKSIDMALREFVANAIDRTMKQGDSVREAHTDCDLIVNMVPDEAQRAQKGYTRVFIEGIYEEDTSSLWKYVQELPKRFLHFTDTDLGRQILPKSEQGKANIYLNGVLVCVLEDSADAICDYNFNKSQIEIDEARKLNEYVVRGAIGKLYRDASPVDLARVFTELSRGNACLETGLDGYYLRPISWESGNEQRKANWKAAWEMVYGDAVACGHDQGVVGDMARRKGFDLGVIRQTAWLDAVKEHGVASVGSVLNENEKRGRTITPPSWEAIDALREVWGWVTATDLVGDLPMPKVKGFDELTNAESECLGFYKVGDDCIHIRNDVAGDLLYETVLEEVSHYVTKATDCSRDFQNFLMRLFIRWMR
jgi:hypothetical protein